MELLETSMFKKQEFQPKNLKSALHYVFFKNKRDTLLQSIEELKSKSEIKPELGTKFSLLFKSSMMPSEKLKFVKKKQILQKAVKRRIVIVDTPLTAETTNR
eukprot:CAMPEP_0168326694 /NCGR_PEP_ID=MMETSP0213-20121227/5462_1 /TAXON_ID=151035 /ORGANISM="Euplotes harpa, Strain FSP1.4" /LENGTH=101 /DNA_ID=CAMNT_0008329471 /DNA_START=683 /DNA_END=988 /DNA_ORIENTATION=-